MWSNEDARDEALCGREARTGCVVDEGVLGARVQHEGGREVDTSGRWDDRPRGEDEGRSRETTSHPHDMPDGAGPVTRRAWWFVALVILAVLELL